MPAFYLSHSSYRESNQIEDLTANDLIHKQRALSKPILTVMLPDLKPQKKKQRWPWPLALRREPCAAAPFWWSAVPRGLEKIIGKMVATYAILVI